MKRMIDLRGFLIAAAVAGSLSLGAFPFLYFDIGPTSVLHALIYYPLCMASGVFYTMATVKRRPDLSISILGLGGAVTAAIPAFILTVADTSFALGALILAAVFAVIGAMLGCAGAVIWGMVDEGRSLRRSRATESPRSLPKSRKRRF